MGRQLFLLFLVCGAALALDEIDSPASELPVELGRRGLPDEVSAPVIPHPATSRVLAGLDRNFFEPGSRAFVKAQGRIFTINGQPFYPVGTNTWDAAWLPNHTEDGVFKLFEEHGKRGATLVRVFAHGNGQEKVQAPVLIQPKLGIYEEAALRRLDLVLATAARNGIRLILVFTNYEPDSGGMRWLVEQRLGKGADLELFYTDSRVKQDFKHYINMLVSRKNTVTGVTYRDDPTIFSWELANEPHTTDGYELRRNIPPGTLVRNWVREMAAYVKSIDGNHMVSTGEEGYRSFGPVIKHNWLNNGLKGVDFAQNIQDPNIDFATVHLYPDNWNIPPSDLDWFNSFIQDRADLAAKENKPVIMEEYGSRPGYLPTRNELLQRLQDQTRSRGFVGSLVWEVRVGQVLDPGYVFNYYQDGGQAIRDQYRWGAQKSGRTIDSMDEGGGFEPAPWECECGDTPPDDVHTCEQQASWNKCGESWMEGYCRKSCGLCACSKLTDVPPPAAAGQPTYTCAQQRLWGKCNEDWMRGYCLKSCSS